MLSHTKKNPMVCIYESNIDVLISYSENYINQRQKSVIQFYLK